MKKSLFLLLILIATSKTFSQNVKVFSPVSVLKTASTLQFGDTVRTLGYYKAGDGGAADYAIVSNGTGTNDGGLLIQLNSSMAKLIYSDPVNVRCFGAKGDATTNDTKAFTLAMGTGMNIFIPQGSYLIDSLNFHNHVGQKVYGESALSELWAHTTNHPIIILDSTNAFYRIKDLTFYTPYRTTSSAIQINGGGPNSSNRISLLENLRIVGQFNSAVYANSATSLTISKCYISSTTGSSIQIIGGTSTIIEDNTIEACAGPQFIFLKNAPSVHIIHNFLAGNDTNRPPAQGIYAWADTLLMANTVLDIESNDIDDIQGRAVAVAGYYSVKIRDNWLCAGRGCNGHGIAIKCTPTPTMSVYLESCKRIEFIGNDIYTSSDDGLHMFNCLYGSICNNTIEYCPNTGLYMINCRFMSITNNQIGNLTINPKSAGYGDLMNCGISDNIGSGNHKINANVLEGGYNIIRNNIVNNYDPSKKFFTIYHDAINDIIGDNITFGKNDNEIIALKESVPYSPHYRTSHLNGWQAK